MNIKGSVWKIFSIRRDEFGFTIPLFLLCFLSGSFFAVGQIFCETLFLKAYGAKGLSWFFLHNGITIIIIGILYNYLLLKISFKKGYVALICLFTGLISLASIYLESGYSWMPFYMYMGNYVFTFFLDIQFFNFAFQFLNVRNAKRIIPFLMGGAKLGGILISLAIFTIFSRDISRYGIYLWAINGSLLLLPLLLLNISKTAKEENAPLKKYELFPDYKLLEKIIRKIKITYSSPIFKYSAIAIFVMSIANQVSEYYFARIINSSFPTTNELAAFLSIYTFIADFITLIIQFFIISRIIEGVGVLRANYIYPVSFLSLISLLIVFPNLIIGILLRFWRKNLSMIIRAPLYNTILAASQRDRMAEVKSFISSIISPLGMIAGGILILLIYNNLSPSAGIFLVIMIGIIYIFLTRFQNMAYLKSLKKRLSFDRMEKHDDRLESADCSELLSHPEWLENDLETVESLFNKFPSLDVLNILYPHFDRLELITKENILYLISMGKHEFSDRIISSAIQDEEPYVRGMALAILKEYSYKDKIDILSKYHCDILASEEYAISILLSRGGRVNNEKDLDNFCINVIMETKNDIMEGKARPIEFIILIQVIPYQYFLRHLVDLALSAGDVQFLVSLVPFSNKLSRDQLRKIFNIYRNAPIDYLINLTKLSRNIREIDKASLLDFRDNISQEDMGRLFRTDVKTGMVIIKRLLKDNSYLRINNYLNYMLSLNIRLETEIEEFIDFEINKIDELFRLNYTLNGIIEQKSITDLSIVRLLSIFALDVLEMRKHFILKAISILTGVNIDEAYDSNLFLKDKDIGNFILEYMESSGKHTKKVITLFEDGSNIPPRDGAFSREELRAIFNNLNKEFIPEISHILDYCAGHFIKDISDAGSDGIEEPAYIDINPEEEMEMLSLIEKIIHLKENQLFGDLKINEIIHIANIAKEIEIPRDRIIIKQGEKGDALFIILDGEVEVYTKERVLSKLVSPSCIGELAIIDEEPRSANVKTIRKTKILSINRNDFLLTLKENPSISINIMQLITKRLRSLI